MDRLQELERLVHREYAAHNPDRADWADWLGEHHVFVVAENAKKLAERYGANSELAQAAAMLHDIADARMSRFADNHEQASLEIAREILGKCNFTPAEVDLVVDDAIQYHSCHDGKVPASQEGKVLATADSQAHLNSDFYVFAVWAMAREKGLAWIKSWVLKKIDRDFNNKILFDEVKQECEPNYLALKDLFSR